jgi:gliding motility-associated-like protein
VQVLLCRKIKLTLKRVFYTSCYYIYTTLKRFFTSFLGIVRQRKHPIVMRNIHPSILLFFLLFFYSSARVFSQASACPLVNAGTDQVICQGQCANLNATIQGTLATNTYAVSNIAYSPYSYAVGTTVLLGIDDQYTGIIPLPFCFDFFGITYTDMVIGANGVITFNAAYANTGSGYTQCAPIPTTCAPTPLNSIMAPYQDIDPSLGGTIRYQTYGSYPCREFVVSWVNIPMYSSSCNGNSALNATSQVVLHEATNIIDIYIQNKQLCTSWISGVAIEGIQNATGTVAYAVPGRNYPTQWTAVNDGKRFSPTGAPNYTIQWLDPSNTVIANTAATVVCPVVNGTYTAVLTNNTCSGPIVVQDQMNVTVSPITVTANNGGPYCPGQTISLTATAGGTDYDWVGPNSYNQPNTQNPTIPGATVLNAGVYTVTMTNSAGCTATATTTVVIGGAAVTANNTGPYCVGATINLSATAGGIDYDWLGPNLYNQPNTQNPTIPGATAIMGGVYTVTVTYAGGCTATGTTTVVVNPTPTPTATNTGPYCAGATIQLNSPTGSATDDWTGPSAYGVTNVQNPTIAGAAAVNAGVYTVTVTNASGCSATATTTVVINPTPTPTATNTGPYCAGQTIQLNSPTGSATDDWAGPGAYLVNNVQNPTIVGSTAANAGIYTVTVTNASGCSATATTTVVVNPAPTPTATNTGPYCAGQTIQLNSPTGSATDDWAGPGAYLVNNVQNPTIAGSAVINAGVYTVTVTNASGCSATATTTVVVNPLPTPTATNTGPYCAGQTIQLNSPSGSATDDWAGPAAYLVNNVQNPTIAGSAAVNAGVYTVTVTNASGCSATAATTVVVNPLPTPTATNTGPYCAGQTIQLNSPSGSATDDWAGPGAYLVNNVQNPTIVGSTAVNAGIYTVTVTNASGCSATATTTVVVNPLPTPTATNTGPYCPGQTIQLNSPTGSATDDWIGPSAFSVNNIQNPTIAGATLANAGVYTVTVTNASGCSATATTTVVVNTGAAAVANNTGPYCAGATINLSSPAGAIDYDWIGPNAYNQNNTQNPTIPGAALVNGGVYTVTVTMAGGCTGTGTTTVVVNPLPVPTANNTGPYCSGTTIQLNSPTGSATDDWTGPLLYNQPNVQNPTIINSTTGMSGVYTVTVTDLNGCSATATTTVVVNGPPTPTATNTGPYCAGATIQLNSPTGSATDDWAGPLLYSQTNVQNPTIASSTVGMSGVYTVTVTDVNGCFATATTTVVVNALPVSTANNTGPYCAGTTIQLNSPAGSATDDWTGPLLYSQTNTQNPTIASATVGMSGVYTVSVTDGNGCNATATTTVVVNALPVPTANNTGPYCEGTTIQLNSPAGSATDDWTGPAYLQNDTQNPTIAAATFAMAGVYTVSVTDGNGCSATATTTVVVNSLPVAVAGNNTPICEFQNVIFNSAGGTDYDWTGPGGYNQPNTQNPTIVAAPIASAGVYTVTVTDGNGCISTATTTVVINSNLVFTAGSNSPICSGTQLDLTAQNIVGATYDWIGPNAFAVVNTQNPSIAGATNTAAGTYTVTATNGAGCTGTATVLVVINEVPTPLFAGDVLSGCAPLCVNFTDQSVVVGSVITTWSWNVEGQAPVATQNANYCFGPGLYDASLTVTSAAGCSATLTLANYIDVGGSPVAEFGYTPQEISIFEPDVNFGNMSVGATSYAWDFGDGSNSTLASPTHTYGDTGTYCVTLLAVNSYGCSDTVVHCLYVKPEYTLYVPNTFTVNDDGLNEIWSVYGLNIKSIVVRIFDRWGEEIYTFDNINKGWPGTKQNGSLCKQDVYVYRIEVTDGNDDFHEIVGQVNLIR